MYQIGDVIVYTTYGICKVNNIIQMNLNNVVKDFYVMNPLDDSNTKITLPVNSQSTIERLHPLLDSNNINDLINQIPFIETFWIDNDNERKKVFTDIIKECNRQKTLSMLKSIKKHEISLKDKTRKLHAADEIAMKDALKLIVEEFSYVLSIDKHVMLEKLQNEIIKNI